MEHPLKIRKDLALLLLLHNHHFLLFLILLLLLFRLLHPCHCANPNRRHPFVCKCPFPRTAVLIFLIFANFSVLTRAYQVIPFAVVDRCCLVLEQQMLLLMPSISLTKFQLVFQPLPTRLLPVLAFAPVCPPKLPLAKLTLKTGYLVFLSLSRACLRLASRTRHGVASHREAATAAIFFSSPSTSCSFLSALCCTLCTNRLQLSRDSLETVPAFSSFSAPNA